RYRHGRRRRQGAGVGDLNAVVVAFSGRLTESEIYRFPNETENAGAPAATRTRDPRLRRPMICPRELRAVSLVPESLSAGRLRRGRRGGVCSRGALNDVAADVVLESLLHAAVRPDDNRHSGAVLARLVHGGLAQLGPALFVLDALAVPLLEQLD